MAKPHLKVGQGKTSGVGQKSKKKQQKEEEKKKKEFARPRVGGEGFPTIGVNHEAGPTEKDQTCDGDQGPDKETRDAKMYC